MRIGIVSVEKRRINARSCLVCDGSRAPRSSPTVELVVWNIRGSRRKKCTLSYFYN